MGVKLQDIIIKRELDFSELAGRIIAIDAPNIIFSLFSFSFQNKQFSLENIMRDRTQRAISHLYGLLYRVNFYYSKKIFPIFCFDGRDSNLKRLITKDILNDFRYTEKRYREALSNNDLVRARQIALSREFFWINTMNESRKLLGYLGIPYLDSPASAESQCAQLVKDNIAHFSNSQDLDSMLFGCPRIIQNLSKSSRRKERGKWIYHKIEPRLIDLEHNLKTLRLNQFQLVDMSILIGCDYFPGIHQIGAKKAYELIKRHNSIEMVMIREKNKYDFSKLTQERIADVRKIFLFPNVNKNYSIFNWSPPNESKIVELMCEDHALNSEKQRIKILNNIDKTSRSFDRCKKSFQFDKNRPKRTQKTLDMSF